MKDNQILLLAIDKAKKKGFQLQNHRHFVETKQDALGKIESIAAHESIIFDQDFAKAFWGSELVEVNVLDIVVPVGLDFKHKIPLSGYKAISWRYHLLRLALSPDRMKYLEKFLYE